MAGAISIHAPTRGATQWVYNKIIERRFQSTLPQGERLETTFTAFRKKYFNPRSHKGSDTGDRRQLGQGDNFNPRSHKGSDLVHQHNLFPFTISIHAPTRGATRPQFNVADFKFNFNPRSHKGSDRNEQWQWLRP